MANESNNLDLLPLSRKYSILDSHLHYLNFYQKTDGFENLVKKMDEVNISQAVLFGMPLVKKWDEWTLHRPDHYRSNDSRVYHYSATDYILMHHFLQQSDEIRRRFYPFICGINPTDKCSSDYINQLLEIFPEQFYGIGEILCRHDILSRLTQGEPARADHPALLKVYDLAAEQNMPVLLHQNISDFNVNEPVYLHEIENALAHNRNTKIIWAHIGVVLGITIPNMLEIVEKMLVEHSNIYFDLSIIIMRYIVKDVANWSILIEKYPDRFFVGTDKVAYWNTYLEAVEKFYPLLDLLNEKTVKKVCYENMLHLIGKKDHVFKKV